MRRGSGWSDLELCHLTRTRKHASEGPIVWIDQKSSRYFQTMFEKFKYFGLKDARGNQYAVRSQKSIKAKGEEISADTWTFCKMLRLIHTSSPTGVTKEQIIFMAIAIHFSKRKMSYDTRATRMKLGRTSSPTEHSAATPNPAIYLLVDRWVKEWCFSEHFMS